jgi:hypothetical protein
MIRARRAKLQRSMWPSAVVVGSVPGKSGPQVSFAEDQDAVGEFSSGGPDEAFGEAVRPRTSRWDLHRVDAGAGQYRVEGGGELSGSVADEEPEGGNAIVEVHQQVAGLLGGPRSGRIARRPEDVHVAAADFQGEEHIDPFQRDRAVDVEEIHGQHGGGLRAQEPPP